MGRVTDYHTFRTALGGRLLQLEIGKVCEQANGQVTVRYGDTVVNCTATASKQPRQDIDFFPLSCDYEEKMYAVGKIPGGYIKREGRPGEHGILTSRLMDRPLRPLFPKGFRNDVSVVAVAMSVDHDCSPEVAAMIGSSVALATSDIPWDGPTGSVKVGRVDGELIINPTYEQRMKSDIDLTVAGTKEAIMMVEAGANEVSESDMLDAIMFAHEEIKQLCVFIEEIANEVGKEKMEYVVFKADDDVDEAVRAYATDKMIEAIKTFDKLERLENMDKVEIEGVMAHEISHIKNYDIRVSMAAVALTAVIGVLSDIVLRFIFLNDDDEDSKNPIALILGLFFVLISPLLATITRLAISRQREFLADATAVSLTRYPDGLISALEKLKNNKPLERQNSTTASLFISNPMKQGFFQRLFSTHPPLDDRIKRLKENSARF